MGIFNRGRVKWNSRARRASRVRAWLHWKKIAEAETIDRKHHDSRIGGSSEGNASRRMRSVKLTIAILRSL